MLDYHDIFMPYVRQINQLNSAKTYATRTILFLREDGTLKPVAIELSLPHPAGDLSGAVSQVILPAKEGVESTIWLLAKAYVVVNDSCYHQLMSHWYIKQFNSISIYDVCCLNFILFLFFILFIG